MKKQVFAVLLIGSMVASLAVDRIVTQDPTKPGVFKVNGPVSLNATIPVGSISASGGSNGDVVTLSGGVASWAVPIASTPIPVSDEAVQITPGVTSFNFTGAGVTATAVGNAVTVTVPSGTASTLYSIMPSNLNVLSTWTTLCQTNSTITTGSVSLQGQALAVSIDGTSWQFTYARLLSINGSTTNVLSFATHAAVGNTFQTALHVQANDVGVTNARTYVLQGAGALNGGAGSPGPAGQVKWSRSTPSYYDVTPGQSNFDTAPATNGCSLILYQFP